MGATEKVCTANDIIDTLRKKLTSERKRRKKFEDKYKNNRSGQLKAAIEMTVAAHTIKTFLQRRLWLRNRAARNEWKHYQGSERVYTLALAARPRAHRATTSSKRYCTGAN